MMKINKNLRLTLRRRLQLYFSLFVIIPIFMAGILLYFVAIDSAEKNAVKFSNQIINRISSEIEDMLYDSYNVSTIISEEPYIQENLRKPLSDDLPTRFSADLAIDSRLNYIATYNRNLFGIYLVAKNGGKYKSNYTTVRDEDLRETEWYERIMETDDAVWFGTHYESFATETSGKSMISLGFPIKDKATGNNVGAVIVDIEESMLTAMINREIGTEGIIYILDQDNNVISHPDRSLISEHLDFEKGSQFETNEFGVNSYTTVGDDKSIIVYKTLPLNSWKVVASLPISGLTEDIDLIRDLMFLSLGFITVLALVAAINISNSVVNPIGKMMRLMKKVEQGNMDVSMTIERNDEIGDLSNSFNRMINKVDGLMDTIYSEQKELRKAELKALQSQINPHFLYNTLATVIWMAREKEYEEIIKIVTAITKYYRIGISRGRDIISIEDEVEHISNYLIILNQRYSDKFDYDVDIKEELYKYKTLKLILQPIVENAIYHGVKNKREMGHISIGSEELEDTILFSVRDTGVGMNEEQLNKLVLAINDLSGEHPESYGLRNVNERIKIFFGQEYGLEIESEEGSGTVVRVRIPKIMEG